MEYETKTPNVEFSKLGPGDTFEFRGNAYLKLEGDYVEIGRISQCGEYLTENVNAVRLTGSPGLFWFDPADEVIIKQFKIVEL